MMKKLRIRVPLVVLLLAALLLSACTAPLPAPDTEAPPAADVVAPSDPPLDGGESSSDPGALFGSVDLTPLAAPLVLPEDSGTYSATLAAQCLVLASGYTAQQQAQLFAAAGFTVLLQTGYDKAADDLSHTCAYTVAERRLTVGGRERTLIAVAVRGTTDGEWYANFDFAPSGSDDTAFAENFLFAAEDVFVTLSDLLASREEPLLLLTGHSRGAACVNLLAMLENAALGTPSVYAYTYATPATVRTTEVGVDCRNIYNHINPDDLVTALPLAAWGYHRLGTDIVLGGEPASDVTEALGIFSAIAPGITSYYGDRHSLTAAGLSDDGLTARELVMMVVSSVMTSLGGDGTQEDVTSLLSPESDFAPLVTWLTSLQEDGGALTLVMRHLPSTYQELMGA